jgi:hypothetical protein
MKKMLAAVVTGVLAIGMAVAGVTTAVAAGSDSPVPYTVGATSLTLPSGTTFSSGGVNDGNVKYIPLADYVEGQTYRNAPSTWHVTSINFHLEGKTGYGKALEKQSVLPFDSVGSDGAFRGTLPSTGYCIVWVQVHGFNEHFGEGGQDPVCTTVPKDAAASVATTSATCETAETLRLVSIVNATWGTPIGKTGPGTYSVTATADEGHRFDDGERTRTFSGQLAGTKSAGCATAPVCATDPTQKYSSTCVTLPGEPSSSDQVCDLDTGGALNGSITVLGGVGLTYTIHKVDAPAVPDVVVPDGTTEVAPGQYLVTAVALPGYTLTTPKSWSYTIADRATICDPPTLAAHEPQLGTEGPLCATGTDQGTGYLIVAADDPLIYYVGTTELASGKNAYAPGTYTVTAVAPAGDGVSGVNPFDVTIASATAVCGELVTLALTGAGAVPIYLLVAAALLMAGAIILLLRVPRPAALHRA